MLILAAIFAAIVSVCSQIQLPIGPVPINLATFAVFLAGGLLGSRYGAISLIVYVLLGAIGAPVFAGFTGGAGIIAGPTGGYIMGYIPAAFITGFIIERFTPIKTPDYSDVNPFVPVYILSMFAGLLACYLPGTIWFIHLTGWSIGKAVFACVIVFIPGDCLKILCATFLINRLRPILSRYTKD